VLLCADVAIGGRVKERINTGTAPFTLRSAQLASPGFEVLPARELSAGFAPGEGHPPADGVRGGRLRGRR
jgi:hypothetical protein